MLKTREQAFFYQAYQLQLSVPFRCPELLEADEQSALFPKVTISYSNVCNALDSPLNKGVVYEANEQEFLFRIDGVGKFLISNGNQIAIEKEPNVHDDVIRLYLFGSVMGALLNQRGLLTLHASAIHTVKGAVLFVGESGAGKSTTLQEFIRRDYRKLADDTVPLDFDEQRKKLMVVPAYPQSKIWQDSCEMLDQDVSMMRRIRPDINKFAISTKKYFYNEITPLFAIYDLTCSNNSSAVDIEELKNNDKFKVIYHNTYRRRYAENLKLKQKHFLISTLISDQVTIKRVKRPSRNNTLHELADMIEQDFC